MAQREWGGGQFVVMDGKQFADKVGYGFVVL